MEEEFTKQDFRKLRKKDLIHLVEGGNITKTQLKKTLQFQAKCRKDNPNGTEPCYACRNIARHLGLDV